MKFDVGGSSWMTFFVSAEKLQKKWEKKKKKKVVCSENMLSHCEQRVLS